MSTILKRIGEFLRSRQPRQAAMADMPEMEQMPDPRQMMGMEQMPGMEQHEHPSNDMEANPGETKMTRQQMNINRERK